MRIRWSQQASDDVGRLHDFLAAFSAEAAARTTRMLLAAPLVLLDYPELGARVPVADDMDVRRMIAGDYEIRYALEADVIHIVRIWRCKDDR